jgi:hypothetical protein
MRQNKSSVPTSKASTSTASTDSSGSPAKKKPKPTDCINKKIASVISGNAKSDEAEDVASVISGTTKSDDAEEVASVISGTAKSDEAKEVASVISGNAKSYEAEEEDFPFLVIKEFDLDEESKNPPPDPSRLKANRKQIKLLGFMRTISDEHTATLEKTCPLPYLICQVAKWFNRLSNYWQKVMRGRIPPQPFIIFDLENEREFILVNKMKSWRPCPRRTYGKNPRLLSYENKRCRKLDVIGERKAFELDRNTRDSKRFVSHRQMGPYEGRDKTTA